MCGHRHSHFNSMSQQLSEKRDRQSTSWEGFIYTTQSLACTACPTQLWASLEGFSHVVAAQPVMSPASDTSVYKYCPPILFFLYFSKINVLNLAFASLWNVFIDCSHVCMYIQRGQLRGVISLTPPCGSWDTKRWSSSGAACLLRASTSMLPFLWKVTLWQPALVSRTPGSGFQVVLEIYSFRNCWVNS